MNFLKKNSLSAKGDAILFFLRKKRRPPTVRPFQGRALPPVWGPTPHTSGASPAPRQRGGNRPPPGPPAERASGQETAKKAQRRAPEGLRLTGAQCAGILETFYRSVQEKAHTLRGFTPHPRRGRPRAPFTRREISQAVTIHNAPPNPPKGGA